MGMLTDKDFSRFASQAYAEPPLGGEAFTHKKIGEIVKVNGTEYVVRGKVEDARSGLDAYCLTDASGKTGMVAYRGSDSLWPGHPDGRADNDFSAGIRPKALVEADTVFKKFSQDNRGVKRWNVTGHSLGGIITQYVAVNNGNSVIRAINFSGSNVYPILSAQEKELADRYGGRVLNVGNGVDPVFIYWRAGRKAVGDTRYIAVGGSGGTVGHGLNEQFRFGGDGSLVLLDPDDPDASPNGWSVAGTEIGSAVQALNQIWDRISGGGRISVQEAELFDAVRAQANTGLRLERMREINRQTRSVVEEAVSGVRKVFEGVPFLHPNDLEEVMYAEGLHSEDRMDTAAFDEADRVLARGMEANEKLVKAALEVAVRKIAEDQKDTILFGR